MTYSEECTYLLLFVVSGSHLVRVQPDRSATDKLQCLQSHALATTHTE